MPLRTRVASRAWLVWVMGLLVVVYTVGLALHGEAHSSLAFGWFGLLALCVPALVCWRAVWRVGYRHWEVTLAAAALTCFAAGESYVAAVVAGGGPLPFPSAADVGFLLYYPLMLAALVVAVTRRYPGVASAVWLDSAVGSLGAASVLAVLLSPVLDSALEHTSAMATAVAVAYPVFDLAFVAAIAGVAALGGTHMFKQWGALGSGLTVFAATDVVYAWQQTTNTYAVGTVLDAGWAIGLTQMALWVHRAADRDGSPTPDAHGQTGAAGLLVPVLATVAGLVVLVVSSQTPVSPLAVALAAVTLLAATARTQIAFRRVARLVELRRQVATDELTGLPNRRALYAEGEVQLAGPEQPRGLLLLDLDKFKEVNDSLGHHAGDLMLVQVGARLRGRLRPEDVLARLGGDEFAVLLHEADPDQAVVVAVKLRAALAEPFALEGIALHTSVSVGIALFPDHGADLSALLRKADIALYKAKASGSGHHVYSSADDASDATRLQTVEELRAGLDSNQLVVHYQPKVDLTTGNVHSVEALVRWDHPTRGLLYPDVFLGLVEEFGLMPALTQVVLTVALDQAAVWHANGRPLTVAVNLSASSLVDDHLPEHVMSMLAARGVPTDVLQLEITEEFLMADRDRARDILTRLRSSGIRISIDDYGTGYSSLSYLRDLPVDELKLDRSFVTPMDDDPRAVALVASTVGLAHSLGLRMVAEGVETLVAYNQLKRLGCDQAQGYFMSRPIAAADLDDWLRTWRPVAGLTDLPQPRLPAPSVRPVVSGAAPGPQGADAA